MPNDETRKTKSEHNGSMYRWVKRGVIALAIFAGVGFLLWQMNNDQQVVRLHGHSYHISVMRTQDELARGLSGSDNLPADRAMVFAFPHDDKWAIWMKDMKYPIDIVWLDANKNVVHLVKNAQPSSYPETDFKPDVNARYVIELPSGTIERTGIIIGDPAGLPSDI